MAASAHPSRAKSAILKLDELTIDPELQMRADGTDAAHASDLGDALKHRDKLPPVTVYAVELADGGERHFVTDGFHTVEGHRIQGKKSVHCKVYKGTWEDAMLAAAAANQKHLAKKRTAADKRRAVLMVFKAAPQWTSRRVAQHVGVSHSLVDTIRAEAGKELAEQPIPDTPRVGTSGKTYPAVRKRAARVEPSLESTDWRSMPVAEMRFDGDDAATHARLDENGVKSAGDIADMLDSGRYPTGKPIRNPQFKDMLLRALSGLAGYDGPKPTPATDAEPAVGTETVYQWREWDQHFGPLVRSLDAIAATHPAEKKSDEFKKAKTLLSDLADVAKGWRERLASEGK